MLVHIKSDDYIINRMTYNILSFIFLYFFITVNCKLFQKLHVTLPKPRSTSIDEK